jgi:hypothetical protein
MEPERVSALARLVQLEARLTVAPLATDAALLADGWERRFVAEGSRATEMAELYRELGFEVRVEAVTAADLGEGCADCLLVAALRFQVLYVRKATG